MTLQPIQIKQLTADGYQWNLYSPRVGSISNELTHFSRVCYFQFSDWDSCHDFWKSITDKRLCTRAKVRESERFDTGWETKVWGMSESTLEALVIRDRCRTRSLPLPPIKPIKKDWSSSTDYSATQYEAHEAA